MRSQVYVVILRGKFEWVENNNLNVLSQLLILTKGKQNILKFLRIQAFCCFSPCVTTIANDKANLLLHFSSIFVSSNFTELGNLFSKSEGNNVAFSGYYLLCVQY